MLVGIDLFARRCIEGVQLTRAATPVTYPPQLTWRQPPKRLGVGACSGFGRSVQKGFSAMNFRILAASVRPRGRVFALLAATALSATLLVSGRAGPDARRPAAPPAHAAPKARPPRRPPRKPPRGTCPDAPAGSAAPAGVAAAGAQPARGSAGSADLTRPGPSSASRARTPAPSRSASPARTAASSPASPSSPPSSSSRKASRRRSCA